MDLEKIGKFIASNRKNKGLTQDQLAEKLGVTNKTISRWETGKYMPDLSLLKPLSDELEISLNELLSGEQIEREKIIENTEKSLINTIDYTNQKIKKNKKIFIIIISIIVSFIVLLLTLFTIDINRMRNNKPVLFSTWGFSYAPIIDLKQEKIEITLNDYLVSKGDSEYKNYENEKSFVSTRIYSIEEKNNNLIYNVYAWVLQEKYYIDNNEIIKDSSSLIPYMFIVEKTDNKFSIIDLKIPRDGTYYEYDMKKIFPTKVKKEMERIDMDGTIDRLQLKIQEQLKLYYHK